MIRKTLVALGLGGAAAAALFTAPAAQAGIPSGVSVPGAYYYVEPCAGSVIRTVPLKNELGESRGVLQVRYASTLNGVVCAQTYDNSPGKHRMYVTLKRGDLRATGSDSGVYNTYAGGIAVPNSKGHCFTATGFVSYGTGRVLQHSGRTTFCK